MRKMTLLKTAYFNQQVRIIKTFLNGNLTRIYFVYKNDDD